ncbi:MAG: LytR family transcriptional regulator [Actinomycetales bacterium]|nr:MAG: LytR family transcriptional regulator [Actinomycetales bacterium]
MTATIEPTEQEPSGLSGLGFEIQVSDRRTRRRTAVRRGLIAMLVFLVVTAVGATVTVMAVQSHLGGQLNRVDDVFTGLENRPERAPGAAGGAMNILVMGTDRRSDEPTTGTAATAVEWVPGAQRTDTIMVLHIDADRQGASIISIPRDSWMYIPGHGMNKVNAAFSLAGPSLAVETIERMTGLRIDHLAVVDWAGLESITDQLGGVTLTVPRTVEDPANNVVWTKGRQTLSGAQALLYVRQRYGLPNGDLDRVRRQQAYLLALMRSGLRALGSHSPFRVYDLLDAVTSNISVDSGWSVGDLRSLLLDLRDISPADLELITTPVSGFGYEGDQSVVYLDWATNSTLWNAVYRDDVSDWQEAHPAQALDGPPA